ncbi:YcxB family protein [Exiguobacterium sp. s152]|uniref:YcxB family protein n=1 Tax=Exiguobacterium sp. s152 TaxID=2751226 RepID=UPI003338FF85
MNETEIIITSKQGLVTSQKNIAWESIKKLSEDDSYYYLYVEEGDAIIVPKRNDESSILDLKPFQLLLKLKLVN